MSQEETPRPDGYHIPHPWQLKWQAEEPEAFAAYERRMAEHRARLERERVERERLLAEYYANLPVNTGVLCRGDLRWYVQCDPCILCGRRHNANITGAERPRKDKLEIVRRGQWISWCPITSRNVRVIVRDEYEGPPRQQTRSRR